MTYGKVVVRAPSVELSQRIARLVKECRNNIERVWLGYHPRPRPLIVNIRIKDEAYGWFKPGERCCRIDAEGPLTEIISGIIPHEVAHAAIAPHFDYETPKWLDEGIAISYEANYPSRLNGECSTLPFRHFFRVNQYPKNWRPFYGQCYSVTQYLIERYGRDATLEFARQGNSWGRTYARTCREYLGITIEELESEWRVWRKGCIDRVCWDVSGPEGGHQMDARRRQVAY